MRASKILQAGGKARGGLQASRLPPRRCLTPLTQPKPRQSPHIWTIPCCFCVNVHRFPPSSLRLPSPSTQILPFSRPPPRWSHMTPWRCSSCRQPEMEDPKVVAACKAKSAAQTERRKQRSSEVAVVAGGRPPPRPAKKVARAAGGTCAVSVLAGAAAGGVLLRGHVARCATEFSGLLHVCHLTEPSSPKLVRSRTLSVDLMPINARPLFVGISQPGTTPADDHMRCWTSSTMEAASRMDTWMTPGQSRHNRIPSRHTPNFLVQ